MFNNKFTKKDPVAEEIEKIIAERWDDDDEDDDVRRADAELKRMKAKPIEADKKTDPDKEIGKLAKKTPKEIEEELKGSQHKLDVAKPKGKLTAADFKKLRKEESEQIDELSKNILGSYVKKSSDAADKHLKLANSAAQRSKTKADTAQYMKHSEKFGKRIGGIVTAKNKLAREETELSEKTLTPAESKKKEEIVKSMKKGASGFKERYGKRAKEVMYATATKQAKKVAEDFEEVSEKVKVSTDKPIGFKVADIGPGKKEYNIKTDKVWDAEQKKKTQKEEVEQIDELSKKTLANYMRANTKRMADPKNPDSMERKMKRHDDYFKASKKFHEDTVSEAQGPTSTYSSDTFVQNANTTSNPTPLSRAKELARTAMSRLKNEMLGKAGTTSEEIDPSVKSTDTLKGRTAGGKKDDVGPGADGKSTKVKYTPGPK